MGQGIPPAGDVDEGCGFSPPPGATGRPPHAGEYARSDRTYARLLDELSKTGFERVTPALRQNILTYYELRPVPPKTRKEHQAWCKTLEQLEALRTTTPGP